MAPKVLTVSIAGKTCTQCEKSYTWHGRWFENHPCPACGFRHAPPDELRMIADKWLSLAREAGGVRTFEAHDVSAESLAYIVDRVRDRAYKVEIASHYETDSIRVEV